MFNMLTATIRVYFRAGLYLLTMFKKLEKVFGGGRGAKKYKANTKEVETELLRVKQAEQKPAKCPMQKKITLKDKIKNCKRLAILEVAAWRLKVLANRKKSKTACKS